MRTVTSTSSRPSWAGAKRALAGTGRYGRALRSGVRHRLLTAAGRLDARSAEIARLEAMPRYAATTTTLMGKTVCVPDAASFLFARREIFDRRIYEFGSLRQQPYIIDGGSNIGLSIIFFKHLYPASRVVGFEPDAAIFGALSENLAQFNFDNVTLHEAALWSSRTNLPFQRDGADAGRIVGDGDQASSRVRTARLRDFLDAPVDLLKLDVEGAEIEILEDCRDRLDTVDRIFVEYHSFAGKPQAVGNLTSLLAGEGFRLHIDADLVAARPFVEQRVDAGMDMRLNIYAFREKEIQ